MMAQAVQRVETPPAVRFEPWIPPAPTLPPSLASLRIYNAKELLQLNIPETQRSAARQALVEYETYLRPAYPDELLAVVTATLNHYFVRKEQDDIADIMAFQWNDVLGDLPIHAIYRACNSWLAQDTAKRPLPGNIRKLAYDLIGFEIEQQGRLRAISSAKARESDWEPPTDEQKAQVGEILKGLFRSPDSTPVDA